jgi:hypothetical protein
MFLQRPQQISDCGEGKYRLRFDAARSEDSCLTALCAICNETQQGGLSHPGLTKDYGGAASNMQCVHEPTEQMSLVFTANHDAGVVRIAVVEGLALVV